MPFLSENRLVMGVEGGAEGGAGGGAWAGAGAVDMMATETQAEWDQTTVFLHILSSLQYY